MRTLPLFSSVAQMPSGVVDAGAGAGAGAGCTTSLVTGAGAAVATVAVADGATLAAGAATGAAGAGAAVAGAGSERSATSSSSCLELKPLKPPKLESDRLGAEILMQSSELQLRGASMRMRWPSIWKETELPPAWAEVVASSSAAAR